MRRALAAAAVVVAAIVALFVFGTGVADDDDTYEVRAIFDNAGFLVPAEEVRIAGAKVGTITALDVTRPGEPARADGAEAPGKAVVVMKIDDPAFQDFREDASCLIRPQSLIGEKFVECQATEPRAAGSEAPPPLAQISKGEVGEGQYLLPLEQTGKAVDLDLLNNIMDEPYPDRFRLILNDLGAGLAARGEELGEIVARSNPALRETNRVLGILAHQNRTLVDLARDSDTVLSALARERERVASFINEATVTGEATAERRADLEETFARFPGFLRELRSTMVEFDAFSQQATPLFSDLREAAPALTRVNSQLEPFSNASTAAFTTLGDASEESGPALAAADPVIRQVRGLARAGEPATRSFSSFLTSLRKTDGFENLLNTIYGVGGSLNAFDEYGHLLRALIPLNVCFDYTTISQPGCGAEFTGAPATAQAQARAAYERIAREMRALLRGDGTDRTRGRLETDAAERAGGAAVEVSPAEPGAELADPEAAPELEVTPAPASPEAEVVDPAQKTAPQMRAIRDLLDFLVGPRQGAPR